MKKTLFISALFTILFLSAPTLNAQEFPPLDKSPMDAAAFPTSNRVSDKNIKIIYSRPQLKGRDLERLVPKGEVWRTGANEAPQITFYQNVAFGEHSIPAGTYSFFVINEGEKWTGIISKTTNVWGSYSYDSGSDVARFSVPAGRAENLIEAFSIAFENKEYGADMHLGWGKTVVSFPFKF